MKLSSIVLLGYLKVSLCFLKDIDMPHKTYLPIAGADRPDVLELSDEQFNKYTKTLNEFMWRNEGKDYKDFTSSFGIRMNYHITYFANNSPYLFINNLEKELQKINPEVMIPSWNYTKYLGKCELDPALGPNRFGSQINKKGCLTDGVVLPPEGFNRGCLKRRNLMKGFDVESIKPEAKFLATPQFKPWRGLIENSNELSYHFWRSTKNFNDPLFLSIQAYHFNLLNKLGKVNDYNIDLDFEHEPIGDPAIFEANQEAYYDYVDSL